MEFCTFNGSKDTRIHTGGDYNTVTMAEIVKMAANPATVDKNTAPAFIPSNYSSFDARSHEAQAEKGQFGCLCFDIDKGGPELDQVKDAATQVLGDTAMIIYSSRGSTQGKKKWRVLVPVREPIAGKDYPDTLHVINDALEAKGLILDRALERTGQPVYLPNKGEFYEHLIYRGTGLKSVNVIPGMADSIAAFLEQRRADAVNALAKAKENARQRAERAAQGDPSPIEWFNNHNSITAMIADNGWIPMGPGRGFTWWASPYSKSQGRSVQCYESDQYCVSFTGSDRDAGIGIETKNGHRGYDAFDVYVARQHDGSKDAAISAVLGMMGRDKVKFADVPEYKPESDNPEDYGFKAEHQKPNGNAESVESETPKSEPQGMPSTAALASEQKEAPKPYPTPYDMFDEAALPPRRFIYGRYYIRGFCSFLASPGGTGKTALQIVEALSIATGRDLLGEKVYEQTNVWMANLEDPIEEMQRRVLAAMKYHRVKPEEVRGRFFMDAGRSLDITFAMQSRDGVIINEAMVEYMRKRIIDLNIGVVMLDPFVGCHDVQENDNGAQNKVMSVIRRLADETNASIVLVHHTRKMNGAAVDVDSIRGAGSLIGAARSARVVNPVSEKRAGELGIDPEQTRGLFEVADGKNNLTPKSTDAILRRFESVTLDNGDFVGVVAQAKAPGAFHDVTDADVRTILSAIEKGYERDDGSVIGYSTDTRAKERWAGNVIISHEFERLGYIGEVHAKAILRGWAKAGRFTVSTIKDHQNRREVQAITEVDMQVGVVS